MLPTRALNVLATFKKDMLASSHVETEESNPNQSVIITLSRPRKEQKSTQRMRHARQPNAYQRWRQRGDCW